MPRLFVTAAPSAAAAFEELSGRSIHRFRHLPVLVLDVDDREVRDLAAVPGLCIHAAPYDSYLPILRSLDGFVADGPGRVANISISHGPRPFDPQEALNVATRIAAAAGAVLIVAAGNDGPAEDSLSSWAQAPWVIGVGAAEADGSALLPLSSVGRKGSAGPLVVAHGRTVVALRPLDSRSHGTMVALVLLGKEGPGRTYPGYFDVPFEGTSVATPRVVRIAALLIGFLQSVHGLARLIVSSLEAGATLVDYLLACQRLADSPRLICPEVPVLDGLPQDESVRMLALHARAAAGGIVIGPDLGAAPDGSYEPVATIRRMLQAMARPVPGCAAHQVGAGFVSDAIADAWLTRLGAAEFLALRYGERPFSGTSAASDEPVLGPVLMERLRSLRDRAQLENLDVV